MARFQSSKASAAGRLSKNCSRRSPRSCGRRPRRPRLHPYGSGGTEFGLSMVRPSRCPMSRSCCKSSANPAGVRTWDTASPWPSFWHSSTFGTDLEAGFSRTFGEDSIILIPNGRESPGKRGRMCRLAAPESWQRAGEPEKRFSRTFDDRAPTRRLGRSLKHVHVTRR